jgi:hypothetical protein
MGYDDGSVLVGTHKILTALRGAAFVSNGGGKRSVHGTVRWGCDRN